MTAPSESNALALGAAFGRNWARFGGPRTADGLINLRIAFPGESEGWRREILERSLENLGRSLVELAWIGTGRIDAAGIRERVRIDGLERAHAILADAPRGAAIALTGHFGSWETLAAAMAAYDFQVAVVHRERDNDGFEAQLGALRATPGVELLRRGNAARAALRALRDGRILALPYDQNSPRAEGIFVPFFGRLACTRIGPARIALKTGVPVVPVFIRRTEGGRQHEVEIGEPVAFDAEAEDPVRDAVVRMTGTVEAAIRKSPDQWTWIHRRYRTQPEGEPNPY